MNQLRSSIKKFSGFPRICSLLLVLFLLAGVNVSALAAGPLFHSLPDFEPLEAPEEPAVTIEDLAAANNYEALIRKYGGFTVETTDAVVPGEESSYSFFYGSENYNYYAYTPVEGVDTTLAKIITKNNVYSLNQKADGETEYSIDWSVLPGESDKTYDLKATAMALDEQALLGYEIDAIADNGDGTLTVILSEAESGVSETGEESGFVQMNPEVYDYAPEYWEDESGYFYDPYYGWDDTEDWYEYSSDWHDGDDFCCEDPYEWAFEDDEQYYRGGGWRDSCRREKESFPDDSSYEWSFYPGDLTGETYDQNLNLPMRGGRMYPSVTSNTGENGWAYRWGAGTYEWNDEWMTPADAWNYGLNAGGTVQDALPEDYSGEVFGDTMGMTDGTFGMDDLESDPGTWNETEEPADMMDMTDGALGMDTLEGDSDVWEETEEPADMIGMTDGAPGMDTLESNPEASNEMEEPADMTGVTEDYFGENAQEQEWNTGAESILSLVVDAKTLEICSICESEVLADGRENVLSNQTITYTAPDSETLNDLLVMAYHYENESLIDPRTVTVVYNYGTMDEMLCSRTVEKGDMLYAKFLPGYELYADPDGTPFEGSDGQSDVTIFAYPYDKIWEEEPAKDFVPAESEDTVADLDFDSLNQKIFEANKLDSILLNHSSVEYRLSFEGKALQGYPDYVYETADLAYAESPTTAVYVSNGNYYELSDDEDGSNLYYVFDFCNDYDPFLNAGYEIVPETYESWWNPTDETVVRCYQEGNEIHLISENSTEKSRSFVENYLQQSYNGETVISEAVADVNSGELIRFIYQMEADGQVTQPLVYEIAYDCPEPRACRNLRAAAERNVGQVMTVTLVEYPGTELEQAQTKIVPVGSKAVYVADEQMTLYEDPDCTIPAGEWDKMSDHTYYMIPAAAQPSAA